MIKLTRAKQRGFTLIELLVVVAITSMIMMGLSATILQLFTESERNSSNLTASQEVQNAGFWFKRDVVMAQTVMLDDPATSGITEFLTLEWTDSDDTSYRAAYTLEDSDDGYKKLMRNYSAGAAGTPSITFVADSIFESSTNAAWSGSMMAINIVAHVGNQNAARTYKISPRAIE